jgi:exoribonuclease R
MEAEREILQLKKIQLMHDKVGTEHDGFVSGVAPFGFFVELRDLFVEGLVHVSTLMDDHYEHVETQHSPPRSADAPGVPHRRSGQGRGLRRLRRAAPDRFRAGR